jgi:hypothetical protein
MSEQELPEINLDADNLYREELITDRQAGSIQRLVPIRRDGSDDTDRPVVYVGQAQIMTPMGQLPLSFDLGADNLEAALANFADAAKAAMERTVDELRELQRERAGGLIMPGQGGSGGLDPSGGMGGGGGMPGGGIQMP